MLAGTPGWPVVALDAGDALTASSKPLTSTREVWSHYRHRNSDGAGLLLGQQPGGVTLVAVTGTGQSWTAWTGDVGVVREQREHDGRNTAEVAGYREFGRYSTVNWTPPPALRTSGVAVAGTR